MLFDHLFGLFGWGFAIMFGRHIIYLMITKPKKTIPIVVVALFLICGLAVERNWMVPSKEAAAMSELSSSAAENMGKSTDDILELIEKLRTEKGLIL